MRAALGPVEECLDRWKNNLDPKTPSGPVGKYLDRWKNNLDSKTPSEGQSCARMVSTRMAWNMVEPWNTSTGRRLVSRPAGGGSVEEFFRKKVELQEKKKNGGKGDSGASTGSTGVHRGIVLPPLSPPVLLILAASTPSESVFDGASKVFLHSH